MAIPRWILRFARRFHLFAALIIFVAFLILLGIGHLLLEDVVVTTVKEFGQQHHLRPLSTLLRWLTTYPVSSSIIITCAFLVGSEFWHIVKRHPAWSLVFGKGEDKTTAASAQSEKGLHPTTLGVELTPSQGPNDRMLLAVKNLGPKRRFHAQCKLIARRNDHNKMRLITFDLGWDNRDGREVSLAMGESCNLLIATAKKEQDMERVDLWEFSKLESAEWSRWHHGDKVPEYDLEVTVFGDQCITPHAEQFTLRAGKAAALEMFKITEPMALSTGSEFAISVENCWVEDCSFDPFSVSLGGGTIGHGKSHRVALIDFMNNSGEWKIDNLSAKITYCDARGKPYHAKDTALWKDGKRRIAEMEVGYSARLVVALTDLDGNAFCVDFMRSTGTELNILEQTELRGTGYALVRLNYEVQGMKRTQQFSFSLKLGKNLDIMRIDSMPLSSQ